MLVRDEMRHDQGVQPDERTEWQKKYDASVDQVRSDDDVTVGEVGALETSSIAAGCMPTWLGALVLGLTGLILILRRKLRPSSK